MNVSMTRATDEHHHVFLGTGHEQNERKTWAVIVLCSLKSVGHHVLPV